MKLGKFYNSPSRWKFQVSKHNLTYRFGASSITKIPLINLQLHWSLLGWKYVWSGYNGSRMSWSKNSNGVWIIVTYTLPHLYPKNWYFYVVVLRYPQACTLLDISRTLLTQLIDVIQSKTTPIVSFCFERPLSLISAVLPLISQRRITENKQCFSYRNVLDAISSGGGCDIS